MLVCPEGGSRGKCTWATRSKGNQSNKAVSETSLKISAVTCVSPPQVSPPQPRCGSLSSVHSKPLVMLYLPLWVVMRLQGQLVCPWLHDEAPIAFISPLHSSPGAHDEVGRPEGEVVQVLMHGVEKSLLLCNTCSKASTSSNRTQGFLSP